MLWGLAILDHDLTQSGIYPTMCQPRASLTETLSSRRPGNRPLEPPIVTVSLINVPTYSLSSSHTNPSLAVHGGLPTHPSLQTGGCPCSKELAVVITGSSIKPQLGLWYVTVPHAGPSTQPSPGSRLPPRQMPSRPNPVQHITMQSNHFFVLHPSRCGNVPKSLDSSRQM